MAAPEGIVWGSAINDYGRIGIYVTTSSTSTSTTATIQVWFWSKWSIDDSNNKFSLVDQGTTIANNVSRSIKTSGNASKWPTSNQILIYSYTTPKITRTTKKVTRTCSASLSGVEYTIGAGNTMTASVTYEIPALQTFSISYNANGKTLTNSLPASHTKYYGINTTVSSTVPTTAGYTCKGWITAAPSYTFYDFGESYTKNENLVLYASWDQWSRSIQYNGNADGVSNLPENQTKLYGVDLKLQAGIPSRENYIFLGWATSSTATSPEYSPGATIVNNPTRVNDDPLTLYAVWEIAHKPPKIYNLDVRRCDSIGDPMDDGTCVRISFDWEADELNSSGCNTFKFYIDDVLTPMEGTFTGVGTYRGTVDVMGGDDALDIDKSYEISIVAEDLEGYASTERRTIPSLAFPIDVLAKGKGIAFGGPATKEGVAEFHWPIPDITTDYLYSKLGKVLAGESEFVKDAPVIMLPTITYEYEDLNPWDYTHAEYFKALIRWICKTYENVKHGIFIGGAHPDSAGFVMVHIYDTDPAYLDHEDLPPYASGVYIGMSYNNDPCATIKFGIVNGTFRISNSGLDAYPVNSIYISYSHASPAELFGGEWERISNRFLWAVDSSGNIGATGGEKTHVLTVNEIPSHQHELLNYNTNGYDTATWTNSSAQIGSTKKGYAGNLFTTFVGGGAAHNNMPPYVQVSIWRRVN